jgi:CDP-glycerol glycerophosphotransferase (TagB/SpsB family)
MKLIKNLFKLLFLWPIYFLLKLFPRSPNIWCFSSYRDSFVDNSKYLFHYTSKNHPDISCYWVTDDDQLIKEMSIRGYQVVKRKSLFGMYIICRSKYVFYSAYVSEINFWLTSGAKLVNLWHGLPLKKIEFDIDSGFLSAKYSKKLTKIRFKNQLLNPSAYRNIHLMFAPSEKMQEIFSSAFRIEYKNIVNCGSPRTDQFFTPVLFEGISEYPNWVNETIASSRKVFIYMPTFRDVGGEFFSAKNFDFESLNKTMEQLDGEFWIKAHPAAVSEHIAISHLSRIRILPSNIDMYPLLKNSEALITDYSSIYIDYLLLDKPIYFYCFDLEHYQATCRSMYFDYNDTTPGHKCKTFNALLSALSQENVAFVTERENIKAFFWGDKYQGSCKVLCDHIRTKEVKY